ncbi:4-(cytidine 5'-diphospho)-2-C-methyl-D-erythritol kinase [Roseobacter sp.]|uniref:4-(cytidine 5'-diphospho)-2-C-methyl-D-erythritol kinase n=1 Tax=Roseobacter sp. TaxID=1907202 RepID=UPI003297D57B
MPQTDTGATRAFAPAKINLTLHVTGQRDDGYHLLDSIVVFAQVGDRLWLTKGAGLNMDICGPFAAGVPADKRNLAWRAAELAGWQGHIRIEKNLPHGGGIGGGSADAGAVLRALGVTQNAVSLGADVPVCQRGQAARMRGVGDQIKGITTIAPFFAVLVNPGVHVATPDVFQLLDRKENSPLDPLPSTGAAWMDWLVSQRNDLQGPATQVAPAIVDVVQALGGTKHLLLARMSGSGSTCFGLYPTLPDAQAAAQSIAADHPDWWCVATTLS